MKTWVQHHLEQEKQNSPADPKDPKTPGWTTYFNHSDELSGKTPTLQESTRHQPTSQELEKSQEKVSICHGPCASGPYLVLPVLYFSLRVVAISYADLPGLPNHQTQAVRCIV